MEDNMATTAGNLHLQPSGWMSKFLDLFLALIGGIKLIFLSIWRNSWCKSEARLDGKTVIVTGCNTGIGKETCRDLIKRGAKLIMACRDVTKAEKAAAEIRQTKTDEIIVRHLDLTSLDSVRSFSSQILKEEPKIHILINNAGIMMHPEDRTKDGFEMHFGVNHLGHFLLTLLLLDRLKESAPARIVTVSSAAHEGAEMDFDDINLSKSYKPWKAYSQSKLANILFSKELAKQLHGTGVTTYCLHPGIVHTELGRYMSGNKFILKMENFILKFILATPAEGAQTTIYCTVDEALANNSGKYYVDCRETEPSSRARDEEDSKRLWKLSLEMVKLESKSV